jgi:hypothetical protein
MKKSVIMAILVLFFGICISGIKAHSPWGACATIYVDKSKGGASHEICHSGFLSSAFNNKVSSIVVPEGFNLRIFDTTNYKGKFLDLQAGTWNAPVEWDNKISSVQYNNWGDGSALLYTGPDRTGTTFTVCNDANLVEGYPGGVIKSIYVAPLHFFRLYKNADYTGDWIDIRGSYTFRDDWLGANQAKSMTLKHWSQCAWFHNELNRGGRYFQVCDSGSFPAAWSKLAASITVPKKMTVIAYKQANYQGESKTFTEGIWNLDGTWNNAIVSVKIKIEGQMTS